MTLGFPGAGILSLEFSVSLHVQWTWYGRVSDGKRFKQCVIHKHILFLHQQPTDSVSDKNISNQWCERDQKLKTRTKIMARL